MANRQVFTLDIETSGLISGYRKAIAAMEQAGAKSSITSGLTKSLDRLEEKFRNLENEGAFGKESSREIQNYQKRVDNAFSSLGQLGKELERVSKNTKTFPTSALSEFEKKLEETKKKVSDLQKAFSGQFEKLGFSQEASNQLAETVKSEEDVKKALEDELKLRQQIEQSLKAAAVEAQRQAGRSATSSGVGQSPLANTNVDSSWAKKQGFSSDEIKQITQDLNKMFADGIRRGEDFATIWQNGIKNSILGSEEELNHFVVDVEALKTRLEETIKKRDELSSKSSAVAEYEEAVRNRAAIGDTSGGTVNFSSDAQAIIDNTTASLQNLQNASAQVTAQEQQRTNVENQNAEALRQVSQSTDGLVDSTNQARTSFTNVAQGAYETASAAEKSAEAFDNMKNRILMMLSATSVFNLLKRTIRETYEDVKTLDKSFASIAMVTKYSVNEMWGQYSKYADMAAELGQKTNSVIQASALFYQQGLDTNEAIELTTDTMKLATLAGNDFQTATQEMTSALRGFKMEMDEGGHVTDVYSELAAHAAASVDDIAQAMARTASIANSAGMSFENTSAFLTQMIETTQESAENIGTSLKTIIARFTELKENVSGTEDSEFEDLDYNKVDKALKSVGVSLKDTTGQFRDLDQVFLELSGKWDSLDRNTQRYVATIAAGSRQQSRFIAMMDNYDRTVELMSLAADAEGKADEQFAKYADTMEYRLNQLNTKWEEFRAQALDGDFFKGVIDGLSGFVDRLKNVDLKKAIAVAPFAIWAAKTFITNFITTIKTGATALSSAGTWIGKTITNKLLKNTNLGIRLGARLDEKQITQSLNTAQRYLNEFKQRYGEIDLDIAARIDSNNILSGKEYLDQYIQSVRQASSESLTEDQILDQVAQSLGYDTDLVRISTQEYQKLGLQLRDTGNNAAQLSNRVNDLTKRQQQAQQYAASITSAFTQIGSAITMAVSAMLSGGATFEEGMSMMLRMLLTMTAQMALQWAALAIVNKTGGFNAGAAVGNGINEGLASTGVGLIIVGIAALIAGVILAITKLVKWAKSNNKTLEDQIAEAEEKAKSYEKLANSQKDEAKDAQESAKNAKDLRDRYNELANKIIKSQEEQEEYNELVEKIRDQFPEIVTYYDEITGELRVQDEIWQNIIDKADALAKKTATSAFVTQDKALDTEQEALRLRQEKANADYDSIDATLERTYGSTIYENIGDLISNRWLNPDSYNYFGELNEKTAEQIYDSLKAYGDFDIDKAIEEYGIDRYDSDQFVTFIRDLSNVNMTVNSEADAKLREAANNYVKAINEKRDGAIQTLQDSIDLIEQERVQGLAQEIKAQTGVTDNIAHFEALMNTTNGALEYANDQAEDLRDQVGMFNESTSGKEGGDNDNLVEWSELENYTVGSGAYTVSAKEVVENMKKPGSDELMDKDTWDEIRKDDEDWADEYATEFRETAERLIQSKYALLNQLTDVQQEKVEQFYEGIQDATVEEIQNRTTKLTTSDAFAGNDAAIEAAQKAGDEAVAHLQQLQQTAADSINGDIATFTDWTETDLNRFTTALATVTENFGSELSGAYGKAALDLQKSLSLTKEEMEALMQVDWSNIDLGNLEEEKKKVTDMLQQTMSSEDAEKAWAAFFDLAKDFNFSSLGVMTEDALDSIQSSVEEQITKYVDSFSDISGALKSQLENGFISFSESQKVKEALAGVGLEASKYLTYNEDGTITLAAEKLKQAYQDQQGLVDNILDTARKETQEKIDQLDAQISILKGEQSSLTYNQNITKELQNQLMILSKMGYIDYDPTTLTFNTTDVTNDGIKTLTELRNQYQERLDTDLQKDSKYYQEIVRQVAAGQREIQTMYNESLPDEEKVKDTAEATKDYEKALDDLAKAQEDVAEKQEKLNETLEEYNDLLYGSDNRKSSLDYLYNYDEAISSFNDEISRSKDLLADAKSIEESSTALQRYANATHNLIAEETAKQQVIQAGLKNYADMIENGSYAYTNRETGQTTNINFGDYARKDSRTGKYVIDQRLINESKFTDDIKDLLEEQVSNYNKYSDELLKSEDNVRKAEKELQDQRKAALKNYTAMETEIAEALKAQYQNEVDALKDKYEAMKDADDDYLDALQEAIDKQRQLRDQENAYEDLAKKEKQLSLMQRDTSGANELETRKLEEEIQDDRQNLLDQAIDNVIDGLSKLYESQQELRDSEMELKDALLENQLYWNSQAEQLAGSFQSADEYAAFLSSLSEEYAMMTLAQQQQKLQEYGETYTAASEYMAMQAMDAASSTGDFVVDTMTITGEEVSTIVAETAETFTTEVARAYNETTAAFEEDMRKAEESIDSAKQALQEAIDKLNECSTAANAAAEALRAAQQAEQEQQSYVEEQPSEPSTLYGLVNSYGVRHEALDDISHKMEGAEADKAMIGQVATLSSDRVEELANQSGLSKEEVIENWLTYHSNQASAYASKAGINGNAISDAGKKLSETDFIHWVATQLANRKFAKGGLVDFTGPAWVDGTSEQPEAFLSSEDTARIGEAAKILADIPWMDRDTNNASVVTNNGGDVSVEINLNIDHISSDTDIDEMIQRVKDEIVDVARPEGTNVILQQQLN